MKGAIIMKNYFYGCLLILLVFISPIYAEDTSYKQPILKLNQLTYKPLHTAKNLHDTIYLSGEDLAALTYGTYEVLEDEYVLTIQNQFIRYTKDSRFIKLNGISKTLHTPTCTIDDTTYLPITVLDLISYPYTLSDYNLSITPLMPYSTATDTLSSHKLFTTNYKSYNEVLGTLLSESETSQLVTDSKKNNRYISFMSSTYKKQCFDAMIELSKNPVLSKMQTNVHLRQLNCSSDTPVLSGITTLPITYKMSSEGLALNIGDKKYTNSSLWSTYNPVQEEFGIDIHKSFDMLIMRTLYSYYRDLYNFKDDLDTIPITTIQMGRSDQLRYRVYLETSSHPVEFQVIIYRMTTGKTIDYYIDLVTQ